MATLIAGSLFAGRALFKYNRKNFMFDKKLKQEREFQEQDMRVAQFRLYREDVRDLVELTVGKMDLYLVSSALLIDRTTVMITKANEALPLGSPEWAVALNAMSLASGVFYLLLCLWLAMYASISAQSFGVRLLTCFIRLPIASQAHVAKATATAVQYEGRGVGELFRVPVLQAGAPRESTSAQVTATMSQGAEASGTQDPTTPPVDRARSISGVGTGVNFMGPLPSSKGFIGNPADNVMPTAMLDHIRLYRRVQLNWQAYDAYARVSLFCGANSLLYSCLYWALGSFLGGQHAGVAAICVALVFATIQVMLTKLDLRLRAYHLRRIALLLAFTPFATTAGMLLYIDMEKGLRGRFAWQRLLMNICAVTTHLLHAITAGMVLRAAWPDAGRDEEALLPGKFRSTLYLDVFGWLLNPTGPGTGRRGNAREDEDEDEHDDADSSRSVDLQFHTQEPDRAPPSPATSQPTSPVPRPQRSPQPTRLRVVRSSGSLAGSESMPPSMPRQRASSPGPLSATFHEGLTSRDRSDSEAVASSPSRFAGLRQSLNESFLGGGEAARSRLRDAWEQVGPSPSLRRAMRRQFHVGGSREGNESLLSQEPEGTQEERYGGREAAPIEVMEAVSSPTPEAASSFFNRQGAPRRVSRKVELPGQVPWSAFKRGTQIIVIMWSTSVVWAVCRAVVDIYRAGLEPSPKVEPTSAWAAAEIRAELCPGLASAALVIGQSLQSADNAFPDVAEARRWEQSADRRCGLKQAIDVSMSCGEDHCLIAALQRGGRSIELCVAPRSVQHPLVSHVRRMTLAPGTVPLRGVAVAWRRGMRLHNLEVFARNTEGELLSLRDSLEGSRVLRPAYEVESAPGLPDRRPERLVLVKGLLLSMRTVPAQASTCSAAPGTRVTAWKLQTGERMEVLLGRAIGEDPASKLEGPWPLIRDLCNSTSPVRLAF